jgi:hypothetical protein
METKHDLISAYRRYGFTLARDASSQEILVFTLKTGYFDNAEIVKLTKAALTENIFKEFTDAGFACTIREPMSPVIAEEELFNGFFSVSSTRKRLQEDYSRFTSSLVQHYGEGAKYEYIRCSYQINGKDGLKTPPQEVIDRIDDEQPVLFLIEAAAGFGKTCTAQEIVSLLADHPRRLPLYAELSRNRQARIFRYILLDEIDRTFPLLSSSLVQAEIKNGRIAAILDGFDELLRKSEDSGEFENREPMLETVSELLTGRAKVIITTRRTVLFDGDEFHQWLDRHAESFTVVRIRIQEPKVTNWLPHERIESLGHAGLDLDALANPVLLSYLRCINQQRFSEALQVPERIVQSYFEYMLDRERERQDLRMTIDDQGVILSHIAKDMMAKGYTAEQREYIVKMLLEVQSSTIEKARSQYSASDRPSREEIANKLASHALLDRSSADSGKIGFVNEFCLGNYVAESIISDKDWMGDDPRFIDPAIRSYAPRTQLSRETLFDGLLPSIPYLDLNAKIQAFTQLKRQLPPDLTEGAADGLEIVGIEVGANPIQSFLFSEVVFRKCSFLKARLRDVTFLNCRFFDCTVDESTSAGNIHVLGGQSSPEITDLLGSIEPRDKGIDSTTGRELNLKRIILKKFWPAGDPTNQRPSRPVYKPMKHLCHPFDDYGLIEVYRCIEELQRQNILMEMNRSNLVTLNPENIAAASDILGGAA